MFQLQQPKDNRSICSSQLIQSVFDDSPYQQQTQQNRVCGLHLRPIQELEKKRPSHHSLRLQAC